MATTAMRVFGAKPKAEFLAGIPIFGGLSREHLDWIIDAGTVGDAAAGVQIITEGEVARSLFVVWEGQLEICKRGSHGAETRLAVLHPGDCLGEMSLIDIQPRSATARALTEVLLFRLGHGDIAKLYGEQPNVYLMLVMNIAREISRRLRAADKVLADLGVVADNMWRAENETTLQ